MAKLGLLFFAIFCAVQLSMAGRVVRDTETTETSIDVEKVGKKIQDGLTAFGESVGSLFTQENADKAWATITNAGEKFRDGAVSFGESVSKSVKSTVDDINKASEKTD